MQAIQDQGICPTCCQPAKVAVHKRGGYYCVCRFCGTRSFTSTPEGAILFRAMQQVLKDDAIRETISEILNAKAEAIAKSASTRPEAA